MGGTSLFRVGDAVELWRVLLHLSILVVCLLLFERALHHLERRAAVSAKYQQLLSKAYRELMILGLIGLGLKLAKEAPSVDSGSAAMTAFQVADLTIFILALALIVQAVCIFLVLRKHNVRADRTELLRTEDLADAVASPAFNETQDTRELVRLRLLRHLFLRRFELPQLFPFAKYLRQAQNNQITHMTDVSAPMWALLLIVAWALEEITRALAYGEPALTRRRVLVFVLIGFSWALLALHVVVLTYFRSCLHRLLEAAGMSTTPATLESHLRTIAFEEARAWTQEDAGRALTAMQQVQEQYEVPIQNKYHRSETECSRKLETAPAIEIRWFSRKSWHFTVMMLLMLNGFYLALVVQCVAYQFGIVYSGLGVIEVISIPLPLALNTIALQPQIFRNFVLVSSIFQVDAITLSEVVNHFREIVELRAEFAALLWGSMQAKKLSVGDLRQQLEAHDRSRSGTLDVEKVRAVLRVCGLHLSTFRFNSVARLLFELKDMEIEYAQLLKLISLAQTEVLSESQGTEHTMLVHHHPLLLQSVVNEVEEDFSITRDNSYLPPRLLLARSTFLTSVAPSNATDNPTTARNVPARPHLNRKDSQFQGMSSRTLCDFFNLESAQQLDMATSTHEKNFAHV
jgi:hypothetical protein